MDPERYYKCSDFGVVGKSCPNSEAPATTVENAVEIDSETPELVYLLMHVPERRPGAVLVAGLGNPLHNAVRAAAQAGIRPVYVTGSEDKKLAFAFSGNADVIPLSKKFDERLFTNDYAVLDAAKKCAAKTILWVNKTQPSELLQSEAAREGLLLLVPYKGEQYKGDHKFSAWQHAAPESGEGLAPAKWVKCPHCGIFHDEAAIRNAKWVCPDCDQLYRLKSEDRIAETFDAGSFKEMDAEMPQKNPLNFPDFDEMIQRAEERSGGHKEGVRCGVAEICGVRVATAIMEPSFMMGSMGSVVGEKLTRLVEHATKEHLPIVIFSASGGARMQEGLASLMQMAKVSAALEAHSRADLLYISVLTDPTTGGVTASFATLGDIILAEPHALIGFAGRRVIQDTIKQTLPDDFQTAEFAMERGLIDAIVPRDEMRETLARILKLHGYDSDCAKVFSGAQSAATENAASSDANANAASITNSEGSVFAAEQTEGAPDIANMINNLPSTLKGLMNNITDLAGKLGTTVSEQTEHAGNWWKQRNRGVADYPYLKPETAREAEGEGTNRAWESVQLARNAHRPTSLYYIQVLLDDFIELHGDRAFADDAAIVAGIGTFNGKPVTVIAEEKGADLKQRIARRFGCPQPEGYRKAQRLMKQAEKFGRPIICLVDTQGAFCGKEAEERGIGNAISESLQLMASLTVPVVTVVLGEGGSGGALALAVANRVAMQENAVYSVLSPEGFASILWKDGTRAPEAASVMKMSAVDALEMGIIETVLTEGPEPAHVNPDHAAAAVWLFLTNALAELEQLTPEQLRDQRYDRFRNF